MNKKKQVLVEWIFNYGWFILVVVMGIGILFFLPLETPNKIKMDEICNNLNMLKEFDDNTARYIIFPTLLKDMQKLSKFYDTEQISYLGGKGITWSLEDISSKKPIDVLCEIRYKICWDSFICNDAYINPNLEIDVHEYEVWLEGIDEG